MLYVRAYSSGDRDWPKGADVIGRLLILLIRRLTHLLTIKQWGSVEWECGEAAERVRQRYLKDRK